SGALAAADPQAPHNMHSITTPLSAVTSHVQPSRSYGAQSASASGWYWHCSMRLVLPSSRARSLMTQSSCPVTQLVDPQVKLPSSTNGEPATATNSSYRLSSLPLTAHFETVRHSP